MIIFGADVPVRGSVFAPRLALGSLVGDGNMRRILSPFALDHLHAGMDVGTRIYQRSECLSVLVSNREAYLGLVGNNYLLCGPPPPV